MEGWRGSMSTSSLASVRPGFKFGLTLVGCSRSSSSSPGMSSFELWCASKYQAAGGCVRCDAREIANARSGLASYACRARLVSLCPGEGCAMQRKWRGRAASTNAKGSVANASVRVEIRSPREGHAPVYAIARRLAILAICNSCKTSQRQRKVSYRIRTARGPDRW